MKLRLCLLLCLILSMSYADCVFRVINYSRYSVTVNAGFYGAESATMTIGRNVSNAVMIKSDYNCTSFSPGGLGRAHINLVDNVNYGWRYLPTSNMIRAMGISNNNSTFEIAFTNRRRIVLMHNYKPTPDLFEVQIKPSLFRDFKNSSSD